MLFSVLPQSREAGTFSSLTGRMCELVSRITIYSVPVSFENTLFSKLGCTPVRLLSKITNFQVFSKMRVNIFENSCDSAECIYVKVHCSEQHFIL